ncbi:TIGR03084 family metal-binding protein [Parasphingorhabdus pacifica]
MTDRAELLDDLRSEGDELENLVAGMDSTSWAAATPAEGWTVAHQVAHLAWTDRIAVLAATDGNAFATEVAGAAADPRGHVDEEAEKGARTAPDKLLEDWRRDRLALLEVLAHVPDGAKLPWFGPPMGAASMTTARLMETWAHGQDIVDAFGRWREPTPRLRHVAHIGVRTRDFAYHLHGLAPPAEQFRVELTHPGGDPWVWGPPEAAQRVTGPAHDFCFLVTQRRHRADLSLATQGAEADRWLGLAQAFAGEPGSGRGPGQFTTAERGGRHG